MAESIRYISIALQTIKLLETQLVKHLQKSLSSNILDFKRSLDQHINRVRQIQIQKSIQEDKISQSLAPIQQFLDKQIRMKRTSQSQRYDHRCSLMTRETDRFRLTATFEKRPSIQKQEKLTEIQEIMESYKIVQSPKLTTRIKWRISEDETQKKMAKTERKSQILANNNIEVLSHTIPQIENRIKLLSKQRNHHNKSLMEHGKQEFRTLQTRSTQLRRFIPRLL